MTLHQCFATPHRWVTALALLGLSAPLLLLRAQSQEPPKPAPAAESPTPPAIPVIRTESRIVLVDAVVTDKKGNYIRDLSQQDFKVYEDNKEQAISSFSFGTDPAAPTNAQKRYMILFFDNSSMQAPDQIYARNAAAKFIEKNAGQDHFMAVVDFGGSVIIKQNFTVNAELLKSAVSGVHSPNIQTNPDPQQSVLVASSGLSSISSAESDYGARTMLLGIRSLAKNLRGVPGRKMLVLFSAGFPLDPERLSELTATIDACNKANVAVYPLDVRGLVAPTPGPGGSAQLHQRSPNSSPQTSWLQDRSTNYHPHLVLAALSAQRPGGGGGGAGGGHPGGGPTGGGPSGGPGAGGGGTGGAGGGKGGGTGGTGGTGGAGGGKGGGTGGAGGAGGGKGSGGGAGGTTGGHTNPNYGNYYNNPNNQPRTILPPIPASVATNQQILQTLAEGTGGFAIYNTNDLAGGLDRIAREGNEFYLLGYVPQSTPEGSCHSLKVKMNRGGMEVRSRSGYCNVRPANPLDGKPLEKQMELQAAGSQAGSIRGTMQAPYFYSGPNVARVNLTMEIPGDAVAFNKDKGKYHANVNVLGIAYKPDGSVGARFSDVLNLELEKDEWKDFTKKPYRYENQFDAAPGTYKLSVVLSSGGDSFAKMETPLHIDEYTGQKLTLGGVVLSSNVQRVTDIPTEVDVVLTEDRTPLIVKGMQITPAATYNFKRDDNVIVYSEVYEPLLKSENPPRVAAGYRIFDLAANKEVFFTNAIPLEDFIQKGSPVVPFGLKLQVKNLPAGNYRLVMLAVDGANNQAPQREAEFTIAN
jgi:VWFA-related protein